MRRRSFRVLSLALGLTLAACASVPKSTLTPAPRANFVGNAPPVVLPERREEQALQLEAELQSLLGSREFGVAWQLGRTAEGLVRVRLGADDAFEAGTATLSPRALLVLSEIARALEGSPAAVVHVLGEGDDPGSELPTSLSARRAASVQSYLVAEGLPATRVRAEGRGAREPASSNPADAANWRVELVVHPVVAGAEAESWMPPRTEAACAACNVTP